MAKTLQVLAQELVGKPVRTPKALQDEEAQAEAFSTLKGEVDKRSGVSGAEPDWTVVEKLSLEYLRKVQKDLRVASYLARAWSVMHSAEGVLAGTELLGGLLTNDVAALVPPRVRGRQQALQWWASRTTASGLEEILRTGSPEQRAGMMAALDGMKAILAGDPKVAGKKPIFDELHAALSAAPAASSDENTLAPTPAAESSAPAPEQASAAQSVASETDAPPETASTEVESEHDEEPAQPPEPVDELLAQWLAALAAPIQGDLPQGDEGHLSDEFERLQQQVNDTWRVREVDWQAVFDQSMAYLGTQSKDLRVMAYCIYAALQSDGVRGLSRTVQLLDGFLTDYGDCCYPSRAKGREAALGWLSERSEQWFKRADLATVTLDQLQLCLHRVDAVNAQLAQREELLVGRAALARIARALRGEVEAGQAQQALARQEKSRESQPSSKAPIAPENTTTTAARQPAEVSSAGAPPTGSGAVEGLEDFRRAVQDGNTYILGLVRYKRRNESKNPISYKLLRNWLWGTLGSQIKTESLRAPANQPDWDQLAAAGDPLAMLEAAENMLSSNRFCLDLNRYTAIALKQLNATEAIDAVQHELRALLARFPTLPSSTFMGDVAVASATTRSWLESQVQGANTMHSSAPAAGGAMADEEVISALSEARETAGGGNAPDAIQLLESRVRDARSGKAQFRWRMTLVRFLLELEAAELALAHLESMEREVSQFALERWDPDRAMDLAWLSQQVEAGIPAKAPCKARAVALRDEGRARICRLAPAVALEKFGTRHGA